MAQWPLVGRAAELRQLRSLLVTDESTGRGGVMLVGPAGVGKTRMALECLAIAEGAGFSSARITATRAARELPLAVIAPLLPAGSPTTGAVDNRRDLLRRYVNGLAEAGGGRRLVLVVDDAHLLDEMSALFIQQAIVSKVAFVVMTVRLGEPVPEPVLGMWKDGLVERTAVKPLRGQALEELISVALGGPVDPAASSELAARSRGNVLFLYELVQGAVGDGSLADDGGLWRLSRPLSPSDRLVELVESRLAGLDHDKRAFLELVAFGEPLGQAELTGLGDPAVAEWLERRGLLSSRLDGCRLQIRLGHPLYGDVLRSRLPAVRVRAIVRSLAEAIEATGARRREDRLRVASWRLVGGGAGPEIMVAGATEARWRYDFPLAERLARAAVSTGAGFEAKLLAAELASLQGRSRQAEYELAELAQQAHDDAERSRVALLRVDNSVLWAGRHELQILDDTQRQVTSPGWADQLAAKRLSLILVEQGPRACVTAAQPVLERARGSALALAGLAASWALMRQGRIEAALDLSSRAHAAQLSVDLPMAWYPWYHTVDRAYALNLAGRFEAAEHLALTEHRTAVADRSPEAQGAFALVLASTVGERGRVRTTIRQAREAVAVHEELGRPLTVRLSQTYLALALALAGRADEATEVSRSLRATEAPAPFFNMVDTMQALAWVSVAAGMHREAREQLVEAARVGEDMGDLVGAASALHGLARLGQPAQVCDRLVGLTAEIDGVLARARAAHCVALVGRDAPGLLRASKDFEAMGADLLAAEAAADAGVTSRRAGAGREAAAALHRAAMLAHRCEGPVTPALQAVEARALLTPAERETAALAATGRSNQAIADEQCLSVRTIENRLQRVYNKLGVNGRGELRDMLTTQ